MAFRYPCDRSVTWPGDAGLPSFAARRHSWGFNSRCRAPFAGLIPLTGGCVSRRRAAHARRGRPVPGFFAGPFSFVGIRRFRRSGPTCRLPPLVHAPIDFRRRDRPPVEKLAFYLSDRPRMRPRFDFWASAPVCGPPARPRGLVGDPALGFASRRVVGHARRLTTLPRVQPAGLDPGSGSAASGSSASGACMRGRRDFPIRSWVFDGRVRFGFPGRDAPPVPSAC